MNVYGIGLVVIIFGGSIWQEKILNIELKAFLQTVFKLHISGCVLINLHGIQVIARVETIDPILYGQHAVDPGTIFLLGFATGLYGSTGQFQVFWIFGIFI